MVRITAQYTGRGPTQAHTSIRDDLIVVLMREAMTKGERSLQRAGDGDFVIETRARYQKAMGADYVDAIETLSGREVIAFMSANHLEPDMAAELFVLRPVGDDGTDHIANGAQSDRGAHEEFDRQHPNDVP
jgi:uncharacterized protein YbcI